MARLRKADDGQPYFDVDGYRIFFCRRGAGSDDETAALRGALIILREAFIDPPDFFSETVTIKPGDTVLDLGGNVGTSALLFSKLVGDSGRVFSFEPVSHDVLARNLRENRVQNTEAVPLGVADRSGDAVFKITGIGIDARLAPANGAFAGDDKPLPLTTLDEFSIERGLDRVDFIKMDIEGAEELALRGGKDVLRRFRPKLSIASYHTDPVGDKQHRKLVRLLKDLGYRIKEVGEHRIYGWHQFVMLGVVGI
jgi:FkbM family methyltransferase